MHVSKALIVSAIPAVLLLIAGCGSSTAAPTSHPSSSPSSSHAAADPLPDDAVLLVTVRGTADNGAVRDFRAVVHAPLAADAAAASTAVSTLTTVCSGEVDASVLASQPYELVQVDYSSTAVSGDWPDDLPVAVFPYPSYGLAAAAPGGGVAQAAAVSTEPGDYVPHCLQNVSLSPATAGTVYYALAVDPNHSSEIPAGQFWAYNSYGFSTIDAEDVRVEFGGCEGTLTELGTSLGGGHNGWAVKGTNGACSVGSTPGY
ncbi:MAG TPA: hypothetical protein VNT53_03990 [Pseudolysinimonas sp.]|nr:hypothetical protein [Pseudolysinimonas sp.]